MSLRVRHAPEDGENDTLNEHLESRCHDREAKHDTAVDHFVDTPLMQLTMRSTALASSLPTNLGKIRKQRFIGGSANVSEKSFREATSLPASLSAHKSKQMRTLDMDWNFDGLDSLGDSQSRPQSKQNFETRGALSVGLHLPPAGEQHHMRKNRKTPTMPSDLRSSSGNSETNERWATPAFETWRLETDGMSGHVRISEFADMRPPTPAAGVDIDAYKRPTNKRDLGHRCRFCRRPFHMLGSDLVAEPEQGPTQRFHPECWRKHLARLGGNSAADGKSSSCPRSDKHRKAFCRETIRDSSVVNSYAEEWRRAPDSRGHSSHSSRMAKSGVRPRSSPLEGLISMEDLNGEKQIARGFSNADIQTAVSRWSCEPTDGDDCAVCLAHPEQPMRLPCGHTFCSECVVPWLKKCALCPMCRKDLHHHMDNSQTLRGTLLPHPVKAKGTRSVPNLRSQGRARRCDGMQEVLAC